MEHILLLVSISVFLFQIVQCENSFFDGLASSDVSLSKYYEKSAKDLVSVRLSGTKFCESILLPTKHTLRKSLQATLFGVTNDTYWDDKHRLDSCCRSLHKCDAYKNVDLMEMDTNDSNILHCECVQSFRICLRKVNTSLSSDLAFIHSLNITKCYAKDHPIIKCVKLEAYLGSASQYPRFVSSTLNDTFFNRCTKYEFDESQPQKLQLFDVSFIDPGMATIANAMVQQKLPDVNSDVTTELPEYSKKIDKVELLFKVMKTIINSSEKVACEQLSTIDEEHRQSRHQHNNVVRKSLEFFKKFLTFYCANKKLIESDSSEMCTSKPIINISNSSNFNIYG